MRDIENIQALSALDIDFMGFIFYEKSKRYTNSVSCNIPDKIKKVGVFVNETLKNILEKANANQLDYIQLHGDESPEFCKKISDSGFKVIKAFRTDDDFDFSSTSRYEAVCDLFIFDASGDNYGGNGVKFNWNLLKKYQGKTAFLLSGGIKKSDAQNILNFKHPNCIGVDINSGFEIKPACKNISELADFVQVIKLK